LERAEEMPPSRPLPDIHCAFVGFVVAAFVFIFILFIYFLVLFIFTSLA
jgi:hypothetical protein